MKASALLLIAVLVFNGVAVSQQVQPQEPSHAAQIRGQVQRRGVGEKAQVRVRLQNKTEARGYISKIEDSSFDVTDKNTGHVTPIPYADVEKVRGAGLSKGAEIGIFVGVAVAIVVVVFAAEFKSHGY